MRRSRRRAMPSTRRRRARRSGRPNASPTATSGSATRPEPGPRADATAVTPYCRAITDSWGPLERLVAGAESLAGTWGARARGSTTVGQERAILRLFGVHGLDGAGAPLAGTAVNRWLAREPHALAAGIALPFAMALLEYDLEPQQLARDVASGAVDLALETALLREPDRRAVAEVEATRLGVAAIERIDAERTVRLGTMAGRGDPPRPWIGATLRQSDEDIALEEAAGLIAARLDVIRIEVPIGRELAGRLSAAGRE